MLPLLLLALLLGACAVRPAPRTEAPTPEVVISPAAEAYAVETSPDGQTWAALGETQAASWVRVKRAVATPPTQPPAERPTRYIDLMLPSASCATYSVAQRDCSGSDGPAYQTFSGAAAVVEPGDLVEVRAGTYTLPPKAEIVLSRSGTQAAPIRWRNRPTELVTIKGPYDVDTKASATCAAGDGIRDWDENCVTDAENHADGPFDSSDRAFLLKITGSWNIVEGFRLQWGFRCFGITANAANNILENLVVSDCWLGNLVMGDRNTIRHTSVARIRHHSGIEVTVANGSGADDTVVYRNLSWANGMHCTNADCTTRARTRSINGDDSNGGGVPDGLGGNNSDSLQSFKDCQATAPAGSNLCNNTVWQENIAFRSVDGGIDQAERGGSFIANLVVASGPVGHKMFKQDLNHRISGGIAWGPGWAGSRGYQYSTSGGLQVLHGLALQNDQGHVGASISGSGNVVRNTVGVNNTQAEFHGFGSAWTLSHNFDGDKQGDPGLTDPAADPGPALDRAETCLRQAPHAVPVSSCYAELWDAVTRPLRPVAGSPLIDAGLLVSGYHCAKADDGDPPEPATSACRHWTGTAPDIGPFEAGIEGNPDKSRCAATGTC
jgi:hypothetical protein